MSREGTGPRTADRNSRAAARFASTVSLTDFRRRPVLRDRPGRGSVKPPGAEDVFPSGLVEHSFWGREILVPGPGVGRVGDNQAGRAGGGVLRELRARQLMAGVARMLLSRQPGWTCKGVSGNLGSAGALGGKTDHPPSGPGGRQGRWLAAMRSCRCRPGMTGVVSGDHGEGRAGGGREWLCLVGACLRPVLDDPGQFGDECLDPAGGCRRRDDGDRHPDRDHLVHAGDGVADDHRRQDRGDRRAAAGFLDRACHLRCRVAHHGAGAEPGGAAGGLVGAGGHRRRADHARDRGPGRGQLPGGAPGGGLRDDRRGGRDRGGGRAADRRGGDHVRVVAVGLRRRSGDRDRHLRGAAQGQRCAARRPGSFRRDRRIVVDCRAVPAGVRRPAIGHLGLCESQARAAAAPGHLAGGLAGHSAGCWSSTASSCGRRTSRTGAANR